MLCTTFTPSQLAVPAVSILIFFLVCTPQYFFAHFEPAPLETEEFLWGNGLAVVVVICYWRACCVDPGQIPHDWKQKETANVKGEGLHDDDDDDYDDVQKIGRQRWCRRCEALKPPRAHHCKTCGRYEKKKGKFSVDTIEQTLMEWLQMHPENGPPLSMDSELRILFYISAFHSIPILHGGGDGVSGETSSSKGGYCLGRSIYA